MKAEEIARLKAIADLTVAKVDILKLKADDYLWYLATRNGSGENLLKAIEDIDNAIERLTDEKD